MEVQAERLRDMTLHADYEPENNRYVGPSIFSANATIDWGAPSWQHRAMVAFLQFHGDGSLYTKDGYSSHRCQCYTGIFQEAQAHPKRTNTVL